MNTNEFWHHDRQGWKLKGRLLEDIRDDELAVLYRQYLSEKGQYISARKSITPITLLYDVGFMAWTCKVCKNKLGYMSDKKINEMSKGKLFWTAVWCMFCKYFGKEFIKRNLAPNTSRSGYYGTEYDNVHNQVHAIGGSIQNDQFSGDDGIYFSQRRRKSRRSRQRKRHSRKRSRKR